MNAGAPARAGNSAAGAQTRVARSMSGALSGCLAMRHSRLSLVVLGALGEPVEDCQSHSSDDACLKGCAIDHPTTPDTAGMHIAYVVITILAALMNGYAASLNFVGAKSVKVVADRVQVSQKWMIPFGILLASGAFGLLLGFAVPALGTAAGIGLVVYFVCAVRAHIRVRDSGIAGAVSFLVIVAAALTLDIAYRNHW